MTQAIFDQLAQTMIDDDHEEAGKLSQQALYEGLGLLILLSL